MVEFGFKVVRIQFSLGPTTARLTQIATNAYSLKVQSHCGRPAKQEVAYCSPLGSRPKSIPIQLFPDIMSEEARVPVIRSSIPLNTVISRKRFDMLYKADSLALLTDIIGPRPDKPGPQDKRRTTTTEELRYKSKSPTARLVLSPLYNNIRSEQHFIADIESEKP